MKHAERKSRVGSRPDRNPFVSFAAGVRSYGIDRDHLHTASAGVSHIHSDVVESSSCSKAELSSYQNGIVAVVEIGLLMKAAAGKKLDRMDHLAAGAGSAAESDRPVEAIAGDLPGLDVELLRFVADCIELGCDCV